MNNLQKDELDEHLEKIITVTNPTNNLEEFLKSRDNYNDIKNIIDEFNHRDKLLQQGFKYSRKLYFFGPGGTGKKFTSDVIAGTLQLKKYFIDFNNTLDFCSMSYIDNLFCKISDMLRSEQERLMCIFYLREKTLS